MERSDDECAEIVRGLIERHITDPDRTVVLDWLEKLTIANHALSELGLYRGDV